MVRFFEGSVDFNVVALTHNHQAGNKQTLDRTCTDDKHLKIISFYKPKQLYRKQPLKNII